jgi:hypothetical protein
MERQQFFIVIELIGDRALGQYETSPEQLLMNLRVTLAAADSVTSLPGRSHSGQIPHAATPIPLLPLDGLAGGSEHTLDCGIDTP